MNKKIILSIVLLCVCMGFCGCSLMEPVSDKDMDAIAAYSAKMVAKYNTKQKDGVVYIDDSDELKSIAKEQEKEKAKANTTNSTNSSKSSNSTSGNATQTTPPVALGAALGINGVDFAFQGVEVRDRYTTNVYDMSPNPGNKFLVMKFKATNTSGQDANIDILSLGPKFKATINGSANANNDLTLMPEDLATFKGTLKANESRDLIILFQFKDADLSNIQGTSLKCTVNGSTNDIIL